MRKTLQRAAWMVLLIAAASAFGQEMAFHVDPSQSHADFTLGDVLHTVHGTFHMKESTVDFDPATGAAKGAFIVDATSGESGSKGRDKKMHKDVLESAKFPEIRFTLEQLRGTVPADGTAQVQLVGTMTLHGGDHPMTVTAPVQVVHGHATADVHFEVPYVDWGLKNPSTLFLRVDKKVDIVVHAVGTLTTAVAGKHPQP